MKGLILINAYFHEEEYLYQPKRLQEEFSSLGGDIDIKRNDDFAWSFGRDGKIPSLDEYAFCVYLDKDKYILKSLSEDGIPLFNNADSILVCDDKMLTYQKLNARFAKYLPKTIPGLLCFSEKESIKPSSVKKIEDELSYPLVIKEAYGSRGEGVHLINNREELLKAMEELKCKPHLYQEFVRTSFGKDVRVMVIGDQVIGAMKRENSNDFRSNIGAGGHGEPFILSEKAKDLCLKVAEELGLVYCGIDLLFGDSGSFLIAEVNSNAFFQGFEKATGINVAKAYAEFILNRIS